MTYRAVYTPLHSWWPEYVDFDTEDEANLHALRLSRQHGGEVTVHLLPDTTQEP